MNKSTQCAGTKLQQQSGILKPTRCKHECSRTNGDVATVWIRSLNALHRIGRIEIETVRRVSQRRLRAQRREQMVNQPSLFLKALRARNEDAAAKRLR